MSDWITDEADRLRRDREAATDKEYLVSVSNYWAVLRSQIEQDVKAINENPEWNNILREETKIENIDFGGLRLKRSSFPGAFTVDVTNGGNEITIKSHYKLDRDHSYVANNNILSVEVDRGHVVLRSKKGDCFIVPEQASQYILETLVRAKDDSVQYFKDHPHLGR